MSPCGGREGRVFGNMRIVTPQPDVEADVLGVEARSLNVPR